MSDQTTPEQPSSGKALDAIVSQAQKINVEYKTVAAEAFTHEERMAKASAALGKLHTRAATMRDSVRELRVNISRLPYDGGVTHENRSGAADVVYALERLVADLAWKLFDFREGRS